MKRGPYKVVPEDFRKLLKEKTNWKKLVKILNKIAIGGYEFVNYNGQKIIAQPNMDAIKLVMFMVWGKYPESTVNENDDTVRAMNEYAKLVEIFVHPHKYLTTETNTTTENTNNNNKVEEKS
jgi:hypothetical protein